jgi:hypothetical protein
MPCNPNLLSLHRPSGRRQLNGRRSGCLGLSRGENSGRGSFRDVWCHGRRPRRSHGGRRTTARPFGRGRSRLGSLSFDRRFCLAVAATAPHELHRRPRDHVKNLGIQTTDDASRCSTAGPWSYLAQNSNHLVGYIPCGDELRSQEGFRRLPMSPHGGSRPVRQRQGQALPGDGRAVIGAKTPQDQSIFFPTPGPVGLQTHPPILDLAGRGGGGRSALRPEQARHLTATAMRPYQVVFFGCPLARRTRHVCSLSVNTYVVADKLPCLSAGWILHTSFFRFWEASFFPVVVASHHRSWSLIRRFWVRILGMTHRPLDTDSVGLRIKILPNFRGTLCLSMARTTTTIISTNTTASKILDRLPFLAFGLPIVS